MKAEIFTFCNYAINYGDKLCILGVTEVFDSDRFPYTIEAHCIAYKIRLSKDHTGPIHLTFRFDDESGENLNLVTMEAPEPQKYAGLGFGPVVGAFFVNYLTLPRPGIHSLSLLNGNEILTSIPLLAVQTSGMG